MFTTNIYQSGEIAWLREKKRWRCGWVVSEALVAHMVFTKKIIKPDESTADTYTVYKHAQTSCPESLCDITVCVIIKWLWQVVFAQAALAASVPYSASLVEFLWELMGRSGRGSQTSAVCESDRADKVELWTGQDGGGGERERVGSGVCDSGPCDLSGHDLMRRWGRGVVWRRFPSTWPQPPTSLLLRIKGFCCHVLGAESNSRWVKVNNERLQIHPNSVFNVVIHSFIDLFFFKN